jgi:hypothetical protein
MAQKRQQFTQELDAWLRSHGPKTVYSLNELFADKSFAAIILILMALPALPAPTGGISHVFELIAALVELELIIGLKTIWLPKRLRDKQLTGLAKSKLMGVVLRKVRWVEARANQRFSYVFAWPLAMRLIGLIMLAFTLGAFLSPPFSGLDTLPSMGVFLICLAILFDDVRWLVAGIVVGSIGLGVVIGLGAAVFELMRSLF